MNAALVSRLARAAFMHHDDKWDNTLKHYAAHKGLVFTYGSTYRTGCEMRPPSERTGLNHHVMLTVAIVPV